ncbi:MAG: hypothetical protein MJE66_07570 [Proteobacteria bacterium]|nr:hypothetical protein [Pseudomonadota bacterium]
MASLAQFVARDYGHYGLLGLPGIIVAASLTYAHVLRPRWGEGPRWATLAAPFALAAVLLGWPSVDPGSLSLWRAGAMDANALAQPWFLRPEVADRLHQLKGSGVVAEGESVYVFPPDHNSVHYLLATRSAAPTGYSFLVAPLEDIAWQDCDAVVVLDAQHGHPDGQPLQLPPRARLLSELVQHGFEPRLALSFITVYRRPQ